MIFTFQKVDSSKKWISMGIVIGACCHHSWTFFWRVYWGLRTDFEALPQRVQQKSKWHLMSGLNSRILIDFVMKCLALHNSDIALPIFDLTWLTWCFQFIGSSKWTPTNLKLFSDPPLCTLESGYVLPMSIEFWSKLGLWCEKSMYLVLDGCKVSLFALQTWASA